MEQSSTIEFSNKKILLILLPLVFEQILNVAVGLADTVMVSSVGESAVSGVSLVDSINILLVSLFMAMTTGGYVIISQALGQKKEDKARESANQMVLVITIIATVVMVFTLVFNDAILNLAFKNIEPEVMTNASIYFYLTAISYPFFAIQSACGTVFRSMGKNKITLYVSIVMNVLNVAGNYIFIVLMGWNAAGVGASTLFVRILGAVLLLALALNKKNQVHLTNPITWRFDKVIIKRMMDISIPASIDGVIFQLGKILVQSLVVTFGTSAIAANAVANNISGLANIAGNSLGIVLIMVTGQLVGAREFDKVYYYTKKLVGWSILSMCVINLFILLFQAPIISQFNLTPEGAEMTKDIVLIFTITSSFFWATSFTLPNALRAANDARYTMFVSILSMWIFRIGFSYILCLQFGFGVTGVWIAMSIDWFFRSFFFIKRFRSGKWKTQSI